MRKNTSYIKTNSYRSDMMEIFSLKMVVLIFNILFLPETYNFVGSMDSHVCISKNDAMSCICTNKDNFTMIPSSNFNIRLIYVSQCGVVVVPLGVITQLEIEKIVFSDIHRLIVQPFAFVGATSITTLEIKNIEIFSVSSAGFTGLFDVSDIYISNISELTVQHEGFGGISSVENFIFQDTNFVEIKNNAFIVTNITNFHIANSKMVLKNESFLIHSVKNVLFQKCSIEVEELGFRMSHVDSVRFVDCYFGHLDTNSVHIKHLETLQFLNNTVSDLKRYAFCFPDLPKDVKFSHNLIGSSNGSPVYFGSEESSIITTEENINILAIGNHFPCTCDIYWMWTAKPFYDRNSSFCIGTNVSLSRMIPQVDSNGICIGFETKNLTADLGEENITNIFKKSDVSDDGALSDDDTTMFDTDTTKSDDDTIKSDDVLEDRKDIYVSSQAVSAGILLKVPCMSLLILFRLVFTHLL